MKLSILALAAATSAQKIDCPTLPKGATPAEMTKGVPINPKDIPTGCSALEVLIARGTGEGNSPDVVGKFGIIVGDPLIGNLTKALPGARGYPVQYPASGDLTAGLTMGATDVAKRLTTQAAACPEQKFVLMGYSQGAAVIRAAAAKTISKDLYSKIVAVVLYGDPGQKGNATTTFTDLPPMFGNTAPKGSPTQAFGDLPGPLKEKLMENCAPGDPICDTCGCFYHHLQYIAQPWVNRNVDYIVSAFNNKGQPKQGNLIGIGVDNKMVPGQFCQEQAAKAAKGATPAPKALA